MLLQLTSTYSGGPSPSSPGSYEQQQQPPSQGQQHPPSRQCWNNQPPSHVQQHPPSPGGAAGSRQSPQPGSHSPGPGMPPSPQQQPPPPPGPSAQSAQAQVSIDDSVFSLSSDLHVPSVTQLHVTGPVHSLAVLGYLIASPLHTAPFGPCLKALTYTPLST